MKRKLYFIFIFLLLVIIFFLSPISGDDWGNYLIGNTSLYHCFGNALGMYFSWEGRFVSRVLINFLTFRKFIWNFANAFLITGMIYLINKLINKNNKKIILLLITFIVFLMNVYTFSQVVVWIAGNITYLFVIPLILSYIYYLFKPSNNKILTIIFGFLNFIIPMFVEHMALVLVFINIIYLIYYYIKYKKINKKVLIYLILSIVSTILMLISPGSAKRSKMENVEFAGLSIIGKIIYNLPNFVFYTFISNSYLLLLLSLSNIYLIKNNIKNILIKIFLYLFMLIIPILSIILYPLNQFYNILYFIINQYNIYIIIYYIIYSLLILLLNIKNYLKTKNEKLMLFLIIGFLSNGIMLLSPTWGYRTAFATYVFLSIYSIYIIENNLNDNKLIVISSSILLMMTFTYYIIFYISIHLQYLENYKIINKGIQNNNSIIEIKSYPSFANCNINPLNEYHLLKFKEYYGINENVEIIVKENNWKYIIFYNK